MRKTTLLALLLCACAAKEEAKTDTAAAMAPPPPAPLTAAMITGSWHGTTMAENSDSVTTKWVTSQTSDSTGSLTVDGTKTPIPYTRSFNADSMIATSAAYASPDNPKGPKVTFRSIGRLVGDKLVGTSSIRLADKPDSVISRSHWEATRQP